MFYGLEPVYTPFNGKYEARKVAAFQNYELPAAVRGIFLKVIFYPFIIRLKKN